MTHRHTVSISIDDREMLDQALRIDFESSEQCEEWAEVYEPEDYEKMASDIRNWLRNLPYQS